MTDTAISALAAITGAQLADLDEFVVVDKSDTTMGPGGTDKKITSAGVQAGLGVPVVRAFDFAYNTPNLLTGANIYTPTVGDILLDAWIEPTTEWDGTNPLADFGWPAQNGHAGVFQYAGGAFALTNMARTATPGAGPNQVLNFAMPLSASNAIGGMFDSSAIPAIESVPSVEQPFTRFNLRTTVSPAVPIRFLVTDPIQIVVSQNGKNNGADPGSTMGEGILYLVTCTPI